MSDTAASTVTGGWDATRLRLEDYFDRTAFDAWAALTSDAPVSGIREKVRAGRQRMRDTLLAWLPADLHGRRILDAGCGTGALAVEAARRGADVVGIDVSPQLISIACERAPREVHGRVQFMSGDMLHNNLGTFDHIVSMDVLIHYPAAEIVTAAVRMAERARHSIAFTHAPGTPLLRAMRLAGRLFPRGDRSPTIIPVGRGDLVRRLAAAGLTPGRDARVNAAFYISHAQEVVTA